MLQIKVIENKKLWQTGDFKVDYFRKLLKDTDYVLFSVSAAEYLGLCNWTTSFKVYVHSKKQCLDHHLEIASNHGLFYTTINQTINDLLADCNMDEQVILEALADQYYTNNYANLTIKPENQKAFEHFRKMAELYYIQEI